VNTALRRLQRYFPNVETVVDATEPVLISVENVDNKNATKKDPLNCALVQACKRMKIADGAMIGMAFSYLVNGTTAIRYKTSNTTSREITTFDRHKHFMPGRDYRLSPVAPASRLGRKKPTGPKKKKNGTHKPMHVHRTDFVRKIKSLNG